MNVSNFLIFFYGFLYLENPPPARDSEEAFDNFDELRTVEEMRDILADRHRVKLNSLIGTNLNFLS